TELGVVAIGAADQPYPFELHQRKRLAGARTHQPHPPNATAIREAQMPSVGIQRPARHPVLHAPVVRLEARLPLLARGLCPASRVEAADGLPRSVGTGLPGLRVELGGEGDLPGEPAALDLEIVGRRAGYVHPQAQAFVADDLRTAERFV